MIKLLLLTGLMFLSSCADNYEVAEGRHCMVVHNKKENFVGYKCCDNALITNDGYKCD